MKDEYDYRDHGGHRLARELRCFSDGAEIARWSLILREQNPDWSLARVRQRALVMAEKEPARISAGG